VVVMLQEVGDALLADDAGFAFELFEEGGFISSVHREL
jgi:hypothetical protein